MKDPMVAVRHHIDAFNRGDGKAMAAAFAVPGSILKIRGQQVTQTGAVFTVALRKVAEGWRIAAWAWAKGKQ